MDHSRLHWSGCYDDHCSIHRASKDARGYYPQEPKKDTAEPEALLLMLAQPDDDDGWVDYLEDGNLIRASSSRQN